MSRTAVINVYRILLKQARQLQAEGGHLKLRKPVTEAWGSHHYSATGLAYQGQVLEQLVPGLKTFPAGEGLSASELRRLVRAHFREQPDAAAGSQDSGQILTEAFRALRVLSEQRYLERCSSDTTTHGVQVEVTSQFVKETTQPGKRVWEFTYRVRVTNLRSEPIQLLSREWTILNRHEDGQQETLARVPMLPGNSLVGQQPILPSGHCWEYYSGTPLDTPTGEQYGKFEVGVMSRLSDSSLSRAERLEPTEKLMVDVAHFQFIAH